MSYSMIPRITVRMAIIVICLCFAYYLLDLVYFYYIAAPSYKSPFGPRLLLEEVRITIGTNECLLPKGLVLYPLNSLECDPALDNGNEMKIHINISKLNTRELTDAEQDGTNDYIYALSPGYRYDVEVKTP